MTVLLDVALHRASIGKLIDDGHHEFARARDVTVSLDGVRVRGVIGLVLEEVPPGPAPDMIGPPVWRAVLDMRESVHFWSLVAQRAFGAPPVGVPVPKALQVTGAAGETLELASAHASRGDTSDTIVITGTPTVSSLVVASPFPKEHFYGGFVDPCPFCKIVAGLAPAQVVRSWDDALCITPLNPVVDGHLLVLPKTHVQTFFSDPDISALTMRRAAEMYHGVDPWAGPISHNIITSAGAPATQTVKHLHVHLVPRAAGDGLKLPWTPEPEEAHDAST